jgi:aconitate hydratase
VTTDHISPAGAIAPTSPAGRYLIERDVPLTQFNSYGSRRGNHEVMLRGTFANVRIRNLMLPPDAAGRRLEGGYTLLQPDGERLSIYDAAMRYQVAGTPTLIFAGEEYGTGSSRDWAAKGTALLGVRAVVARSFERIHRANLVGMGVLPLQFIDGDSAETLALDGSESFDLSGLEAGITPQQTVGLLVRRRSGTLQRVPLRLRVDTPVETEYLRHGGILPCVLRELLAA